MDARVKRVNELLHRMKKGDQDAVDSLVREFGAFFLNMAKKYLFDPDYADDLLSETLLELYRGSIRSFDPKFNGLNWIYTIIRRKAYKYNGKYERYIPLDSLENSVGCETSLSAFTSDIALKEALLRLSEYENEILYHKYWEGLTVREIAARLHKPRSTIQYDIKAALKKLEKLLKEDNNE